jgi:hypothetical protein
MIGLLRFVLAVLASPFKSKLRLEAENAVLRLLRWHRARFSRCWRWKSRRQGGRPQIETELRSLIRQMNIENPLWGAPRIHGELLKLGFEVAQSSVAKYDAGRQARDGTPFCVTMLKISPQWTCSLSRPLASPALRLHHRAT